MYELWLHCGSIVILKDQPQFGRWRHQEIWCYTKRVCFNHIIRKIMPACLPCLMTDFSVQGFTRATFDLTATQRDADCWPSVSWVGESVTATQRDAHYRAACCLRGNVPTAIQPNTHSLFPARKRSNSSTTQYSQPVSCGGNVPTAIQPNTHSLFPAGKRSNSNTTQYSQPVGQLASCVDKWFWQNNGMLSVGGNKFWTPCYRMIRICCSSNHRLAILMDMLQDDR